MDDIVLCDFVIKNQKKYMDDREIRGGNRGGRALFSWDAVKADKQKSNYLGNSIMAATGNWTREKDFYWYSKAAEDQTSSKEGDNVRKEVEAVKQKERDLLNSALGLKPAVTAVNDAKPSAKPAPVAEGHLAARIDRNRRIDDHVSGRRIREENYNSADQRRYRRDYRSPSRDRPNQRTSQHRSRSPPRENHRRYNDDRREHLDRYERNSDSKRYDDRRGYSRGDRYRRSDDRL